MPSLSAPFAPVVAPMRRRHRQEPGDVRVEVPKQHPLEGDVLPLVGTTHESMRPHEHVDHFNNNERSAEGSAAQH